MHLLWYKSILNVIICLVNGNKARTVPVKRKIIRKNGGEYSLQVQICQYLSLVLDPKKVIWTSFPAGGGGKIRGAMLKKSGLVSGWPDLQLFKSGIYHGIEIKTTKGFLSENQKEMHKKIKKNGGKVAVCRSINDIESVLNDWTLV